MDTVYILLNSIKHKFLDKFRFYNAIYTFKNYLTPIFFKISFQCQPFTAYHRNMQIYRFSEKPFIFCPLTKWGTRGIFWPLLFAKAQCESFDVCFTFKVHTLIQEKTKKEKKRKKKRKTSYSSQYIIWTIFGTWKFFCEGMWIMWCVFHFQSSYSHSGKKKEKKRKTSYSSQYIIWTIFGTRKFFCEGKWSIELLISLKKDFIFSSSYYIVVYPTVCTFFKRYLLVGFFKERLHIFVKLLYCTISNSLYFSFFIKRYLSVSFFKKRLHIFVKLLYYTISNGLYFFF